MNIPPADSILDWFFRLLINTNKNPIPINIMPKLMSFIFYPWRMTELN